MAPGAEALVRDAAAYGCIVTQGRGTFGAWNVESPTLIRFGQVNLRRVFRLGAGGARGGVLLRNLSETEPLVMLKHFGPKPLRPLSPLLKEGSPRDK